MKRVLLAVLLVMSVVLFATQTQAEFDAFKWLSDTWIVQAGKTIGQGAVDTANLLYSVGKKIAQAAACTISSGICPTDCSFAQRMLEYTQNSCWFCGVLGSAFDIMNDIVSQLCAGMKNTFLTLLGLGLLFWLLFRVGKVVIDITPQVDEGLVWDVVKQVMRVIVAVILINFYFSFFDYIVSPLLRLSIGLGNQITATNLNVQTIAASRSGDGKPSVKPVEFAEQGSCPELQAAMANAAQEAQQNAENGTQRKKVFTDVEKESFLCYVRMGSSAMASGMAIGSTAINAWSEMPLLEKIRHLQLPIIGLEIFLSFFFLFIAFPLKLFDPLVNLTFVCAMFPLWVVLWAFPFGKDYVKKAMDIFISVIVHLIVISIMTVIVIEIMSNALGGHDERTKLYQDLLNCVRPAAVFEGVAETSGGSAVAKLATGGLIFGLVGRATLMTAALGFFSFQLFKKTKSIADEFKGGLKSVNVSEGASKLTGGALSASGQAASSLTSAGYHAAGGGQSSGGAEGGTGAPPSRWRAAKQALGFMAGGGIFGTAAAIRQFNNTPAPANHTGTGTVGDSVRTSLFGRTLGRLFGVRSWTRETDDDGNVYRLDSKTGVNTKTAEDGSFVRYNRRNQTYNAVSRNGRELGSYDYRTGMVTIDGQTYQINDSGTPIDMSTGAAVTDTALAQRILDIKRNAELERTEFERRLTRNRMT